MRSLPARARHFDNFLHVCGEWYAQVTGDLGGKPRGSNAKRYEKCVFLSTVGWLGRRLSMDKWLKVSQDAGSALIHDVIVHVLTATLHLIVNI